MDPATAATMKQFMLEVVNDAAPAPPRRSPASRSRARPEPRRPRPARHPHAWFIAFAPADEPRYAIAVLVEHGGTDGEAETTGGRVAAPIAAASARDAARDVTPCDSHVSRSHSPSVATMDR